jgi:hypothetical protein
MHPMSTAIGASRRPSSADTGSGLAAIWAREAFQSLRRPHARPRWVER